MTEYSSNKLLFIACVVAGVAVWAAFAAFETEPWDSIYGWISLAGMGLIFGYIGRGNPVLWPLGIFLGQAVFGVGSLVQSLYFYGGGGVNLFIPFGLLFLVFFTLPALAGSFIGFGLKRALSRNENPDAQKPRAK